MAAEGNLRDYIRAGVRKKKGEIRSVKWLNRHGAPDDMVWVPGWRWPKMPEMKAPGKPLKPHQMREHKRLKKMGIECCKLDSEEDIDRFLNAKT